MHIPQNTLRENYLDIISLLVEHDPAGYASELMFDADQLNFFLHDKARSQEIIKFLIQEEKAREKEQQKKPVGKRQKTRSTCTGTTSAGEQHPEEPLRTRILPNRGEKTALPFPVNTV